MAERISHLLLRLGGCHAIDKAARREIEEYANGLAARLERAEAAIAAVRKLVEPRGRSNDLFIYAYEVRQILDAFNEGDERDDRAARLERAEAAIERVRSYAELLRKTAIQRPEVISADVYWVLRQAVDDDSLDAAPTAHRECSSAACAQINEWYVQAERRLEAVREAVSAFCHGEQAYAEHGHYCVPILEALDAAPTAGQPDSTYETEES